MFLTSRSLIQWQYDFHSVTLVCPMYLTKRDYQSYLSEQIAGRLNLLLQNDRPYNTIMITAPGHSHNNINTAITQITNKREKEKPSCIQCCNGTHTTGCHCIDGNVPGKKQCDSTPTKRPVRYLCCCRLSMCNSSQYHTCTVLVLQRSIIPGNAAVRW